MQQYLEIKGDHEDAVLFFQMGDFYEMFFEDAEKASSILDIALTSRNRNDPTPIPMCGVPHHSARSYVAKLLEAGVKVAICEQMEVPRRGIVRREVTRVVTPGTSLDEESLAPDRGNFLASLASTAGGWALAWSDFSTGEVRVTDAPGLEGLEDELGGIGPSELLVDDGVGEDVVARLAEVVPRCLLTRGVRTDGDGADVSVATAASWKATDLSPECRDALRRLLGYLDRTQGGRTEHLREPVYHEAGSYLHLDRATRRNLEIVESIEGGRKGSLLGAIDRAVTPMGKRLTRDWLLRPLADVRAIGARLDAVERFCEGFELRSDLRDGLREIGDLERLAGRLGAGTAAARDLVRLADALESVATLGARLEREAELPSALATAAGGLDPLDDVRALIRRAIVDEPPATVGRGATVREGYHDEVDRVRAISAGGKGWMAEFEAAERERTGIARLKIGYNKVFGYYLEASRASQDKIPEEYERKQTLTNAERYITPELKQREAEVLGAEERLTSLENHLLGEITRDVAAHLAALSRTAAAIASLDVLAGLAETAHTAGFVRPEMCENGALDIVEGRHPVVEAAIGTGFVPNDCRLGEDGELVMVITGPNMAGKSTYLRQVALVALLAHCGSYVPATSARVPLVDRIFTRIGASDNLARGQSTFMVEMTETANILRSMSDRSLVVLDEIGRGTSTFDGISIAWAVAEAMVRGRVKTLFATHYHELAGLAAEHDTVANYSVAVRRYKGDIIFLYRVVEGATSGSYGIEVARLAGVPDPVIDSARNMLARFESGPGPSVASAELQPSLFGPQAVSRPASASCGGDDGEPAAGPTELAARLAATEIDHLTPLEALNLLDDLVRTARLKQSC